VELRNRLESTNLDEKLSTEISFLVPKLVLLVARRTAEDQYIGINAGESSHKGIVELNYQLHKIDAC
jgi:iron complex outermembrane receptor protein